MSKRAGIVWTHFPKDRAPNPTVKKIVEAFESHSSLIDSEKFGKSGTNKAKTPFDSNFVLEQIEDDLMKIEGFSVEMKDEEGKKQLLRLPVLWGDNGKSIKEHRVDGWSEEERIMLEVEAGMMIISNKTHQDDLIKALQIPNVKHFVIACANVWDYHGSKKKPYQRVERDFSAFYHGNRLVLPFETLTIIGF